MTTLTLSDFLRIERVQSTRTTDDPLRQSVVTALLGDDTPLAIVAAKEQSDTGPGILPSWADGPGWRAYCARYQRHNGLPVSYGYGTRESQRAHRRARILAARAEGPAARKARKAREAEAILRREFIAAAYSRAHYEGNEYTGAPGYARYAAVTLIAEAIGGVSPYPVTVSTVTPQIVEAALALVREVGSLPPANRPWLSATEWRRLYRRLTRNRGHILRAARSRPAERAEAKGAGR